jgi:anti-sigma regulatory factor (Ser/Thr protein kinase)
VTAAQAFRCSVEALADVFAFTSAACDREGVDRGLLPAVDLALEELFTNVVKYGRSRADVRIEIRGIAGGVEVTLTAEDVDDFDATQAPPVDTTLPIELRQPGGLGLHLIRQLVDAIEYEYQGAQRRSRVTFRKTLP